MPTARPTKTPGATGGEIAFSCHRIYVVNADGSNLRAVGRFGVFHQYPDWSPDGQKIVYENERGQSIGVMNADGSDITVLISIANWWQDYTRPAWSPDGQRIALASYDGDLNSYECGDIYVMNADGTDLKRLTSHHGCEDYPSWSPDGRKIIYSRWIADDASGQIRLMDANGTNDVVLAQSSEALNGPKFSPDGNRIVYYFRPGGPGNPGEIYVMNADGSNPVRLGQGAYPTWSPDGRRIAFTCRPIEQSNLCIMNADGSDVVNITAQHNISVCDKDWKP